MYSFLIICVLFATVYSCNKVTCAAYIGACGGFCACDVPACECCPECLACLGTMWSECCDCFGLCSQLAAVNSTKVLSHCVANCPKRYCSVDCPVGQTAYCECITGGQYGYCFCR